MIYVDEVPITVDGSTVSSSEGSSLLVELLDHPILVSTSHAFKSLHEQKVTCNEGGSESSRNGRYVYLFQREYATVDPLLVDFIGTDEATTCVGLVIRNRKNRMTSVSHMDSPRVVDTGLTQMLSQVVDHGFDTELDVHLVGGFEDLPIKQNDDHEHRDSDGHSFPLCCKIVEALQKQQEKFHIQTLFILRHNTKWDSQGTAYPVFNGILVETSTGSVRPAIFDRTSRFPDEIVRRIRVSAACEDPRWKGKLLETYDTRTDRYVIAACSWGISLIRVACTFRHLPDEEILFTCSTSPYAEGPDFVDNERRVWDYLLKYPDWTTTFPLRQPRVYERTADGNWKRC